MNSLEFIKQHVTEWPYSDATKLSLSFDGHVIFYSISNNMTSVNLETDLTEHFAPDYYDGKVWTREEFESVGQTVTSFNNVTHNKYEREITDRQGNSATVDVYDVIVAFGVTCPATQDAIKKLLCTGDLSEARDSITRAIELLR